VLEDQFHYSLQDSETGMSQDSLISIVTAYGLDDQVSKTRSGRDLSLSHHVQIVSGAHPVSYPMSTGDYFPMGGTTGAHLNLM
jgi:hypothetical protein